MTLLLGCAMKDSAFLSTDTRYFGGDRYEDIGGKLVSLRGGWGAGSGNLAWVRLAFDAIQPYDAGDIAAQCAAIRDLSRSDALCRIADAWAGDSRRAAWRAAALEAAPRGAIPMLGNIVVLFRNAAGYSGAVIDDAGDTTPMRTGRPFCAPPPLLPVAAVEAQIQSWEPPPTEWASICQRVAETFLWVAERSTLMSSTVQLVWMTPTADHILHPTPAADLLSTVRN